MSTATGVVDNAFIYIIAIAVLLFIGIIFVMIFFVIRYRRSRHPKAADISGDWRLETLWIVIPTLIVITMFFEGLAGFQFLKRPPEGSFPIKVHARQYSWLFEYENGKESPDLVVPVGQPILVNMVSEDVIHSFYIPNFRVKQDVVPGITTRAWFQPATTGTFDILCAEYCGVEHSAMKAKLYVVSQDQFEQWYGEPLPASVGTAGTGGK